jgi:hypothetical protein
MAAMKVNPEEVDSMLAKELTNMSFAARRSVQEEIHGVHSLAVTETPELIHRSLLQFQDAIDSFSGDKEAYEDAMISDSSFVCSEEVQLRFLRADFFDPQKAAVRFLSHLECLMKWFGPMKLLRPLQLSDLDKEEMEFVRAGGVQILPSRDRAGRLVQVIIIDDLWFQQTQETRVSQLSHVLYSC